MSAIKRIKSALGYTSKAPSGFYFQKEILNTDVAMPIFESLKGEARFFNQVVLTYVGDAKPFEQVIQIVEKEKSFWGLKSKGYVILKKEQVVMKSIGNVNYFVSLFPSLFTMTCPGGDLSYVGCFGSQVNGEGTAIFNVNCLEMFDKLDGFALADMSIIFGLEGDEEMDVPPNMPVYSGTSTLAIDEAKPFDDSQKKGKDEEGKLNPVIKSAVEFLNKQSTTADLFEKTIEEYKIEVREDAEKWIQARLKEAAAIGIGHGSDFENRLLRMLELLEKDRDRGYKPAPNRESVPKKPWEAFKRQGVFEVKFEDELKWINPKAEERELPKIVFKDEASFITKQKVVEKPESIREAHKRYRSFKKEE